MHDAAITRQELASFPDDIGDPKVTDEKLAMLKEIAASLIEEIDGLLRVQNLDLSFNLGDGIDLPDEMRKFEMHFIRSALERTGGHQTRAARLLGIRLTTLNQKLKKFGIHARKISSSSGI